METNVYISIFDTWVSEEMTMEEMDLPELTPTTFKDALDLVNDGEKAMDDLEKRLDNMEKNMNDLLQQLEKLEDENKPSASKEEAEEK
ncbi:Cmi7p NDAI_0B01100 [Naumovozyma dairenensis CBS 421]|uniref:Uncharacterized protein n=1 Tax=Naumovozyma dairenensis (strain ATCC 10597 / BCRC 20456 / CBS 421 / NBRC 0211 / NRRL Y-12639) TaxID=1071378 RepID=G0W5T3_NAUDC|nr:hypothetical protein NDAI_0B01100 [Naumovozyma dairenensis CBS 421]CCD23144.1 hypothetical protein NDAI_0B01100 [Naumovozyma dairenensis CBS 421]